MKNKLAISLLALVCSAVSMPALAGTVYSSGDPNFEFDAWTVGPYYGYQFDVTNEFTLTQTTTLNAATFSYWGYPGDSLESVDWSLGESQFGTEVASGTATTTFVNLGSNSDGFDEDTASFGMGTVTLGAGTYYFTLANAVTADANPIFWDENDGSSIGYGNYAGSIGDDHCNLGDCGLSGGETFTLEDNPIAATPEPSSLLLLGSGLAGFAGLIRRKITR